MKIIIFNKTQLWIVISMVMILLAIFLYKFYGLVKESITFKDCYGEITYQSDQNDGQEKRETEYFRPSNQPILNDKEEFDSKFFNKFYGKEPSEIVLPNHLFVTPEESLINYFSVLREAANPSEGKGTGCGSIGFSKAPYPVAYSFLSSNYQDELSYDEYLDMFKNILHINLIKLHSMPQDENLYFVEIETIEGSETGVGYFAYFYGFITLEQKDDIYKISDMKFYGEDYLCAPYHGWDYIAEVVVDIKYGEWCSLVQKRYETQQDDYVKNIIFDGTDGEKYRIEFYQLTNGKDIEIAQYRESSEGWKLIEINPEDCLEKND